jgi:hypothetical protein
MCNLSTQERNELDQRYGGLYKQPLKGPRIVPRYRCRYFTLRGYILIICLSVIYIYIFIYYSFYS